MCCAADADARWVGGSDAALEGEWRWQSDGVLFSNGGALLTGIGAWIGGEPSNTLGAEHWLLINYNVLGRFNDAPNYLNWKYICQHPRRPIPLCTFFFL